MALTDREVGLYLTFYQEVKAWLTNVTSEVLMRLMRSSPHQTAGINVLSGNGVDSLTNHLFSLPTHSEWLWQRDWIIQVRHVCVLVAKVMENLFA